MLSIIIPTLWRSHFFEYTVHQIKETDGVELIIIDNEPAKRPNWDFSDPKIRIIEQKENIGVNPAWNLGVQNARYDWLLIQNDDVVVNLDNIVLNLKHNTVPKTLCGLPNNFFHTELNKTIALEFAVPIKYRNVGFGQLLLLPKECYHPIPDEMKIYMGDDVLWQHQFNQDRRPMVFMNLKVIGEAGKTSSEISSWSINHPDSIFYWHWHRGAGFHWPFPEKPSSIKD